MSNPDSSVTRDQSHGLSGAGIPASGPPPGAAVSAVLLGLPEVVNGRGGALPLGETGIECELRVPVRITVGGEKLDTDVFLAAGRRRHKSGFTAGNTAFCIWVPKRGAFRPGARDWLDARHPGWRPVLEAQIMAAEADILREYAYRQQQSIDHLSEQVEELAAKHFDNPGLFGIPSSSLTDAAKRAMGSDHRQNAAVLCRICDTALSLLTTATERLQSFVDHANDWASGKGTLQDTFQAAPDMGEILDEFEDLEVFRPINTLFAYMGEIHADNFVAFETPAQAANDVACGFLGNAPSAARKEALKSALARAAQVPQSPEEARQ